MTIQEAVAFTVSEFERAETLHHRFHSGHEGYAVIREELDELWDAIKAQRGYTRYAHGEVEHEAIQVAAMALRFLVNLCDADGVRAYRQGVLRAEASDTTRGVL